MGDFWKTILITVVSSGIMVLANYFLFIKRRFRELERTQKIEAYGEFLDAARGFLNDPNLNFDQALGAQKDFIKRFYNKIWVYASEDVIKAVNKFFDTVSITYVNEDDKTRSLNDLIAKIRADLGLKTGDDLQGKYKIYTPNRDVLEKEKPGRK